MSKIILKALSQEKGLCLSHAMGIRLQAEVYLSEGEKWKLEDRGNGKVSLVGTVLEEGLYLSHAQGKIWLQHGYQGEGELWAKINA